MFIDTNVLVYAATAESPFKQRSREAVAHAAADGGSPVSG
jgi:predicted nucleic acid-binding protein